MIYVAFVAAIVLVIYGLYLEFGPEHKWPTGNVDIYQFHAPWYMIWSVNTWWQLNMNNCYGMTPHSWNQNYKAKGEKKVRYHDTGICTKCGKRWSFSSH